MCCVKITYVNKILSNHISSIEDVGGERIAWLVGILELGNFFVASPNRDFLGLDYGGIIAT